MVDFNIIFTPDSIDFTDLTDYTGLTITSTKLEVIYPRIQDNLEDNDNFPIILDLYNENTVSLGDNFNFVIDDIPVLNSIIDGIYRFKLVLYNNEVIVEQKIKYFYNDQVAIYPYLLDQADLIMDDQCCSKWNKLAEITALLDLVASENVLDRYLEAQEIIDYINTIINGCGSDNC